MKHVTCWNDLAAYGIVPLTGEACGLSYRLLCDLTWRGQLVVEKCLGTGLTCPPNWNRGPDADPHVGSVMLVPEMLVPLGVFALLENGCVEVWQVGQAALIGIEPDDPPDEVGVMALFHRENRRRVFRYGGDEGDRNTHRASGRIT